MPGNRRQPTNTLVARSATIAGAMLLLAFSSQSAAAQDGDADRWRFKLAPYVWMVNIDADRTLGHIVTPMARTFGENLTHLRFAGFAEIEASKGRWAGIFTVSYAKTQGRANAGGVASRGSAADFSYTMFTSELLAVFGPRPSSRWIEVLAGFRYTSHEEHGGIPAGPADAGAGFRRAWIDPIVGGRVAVDLGSRFGYVVRGDLGGFGVGSDFTSHVDAGVFVRLSRKTDLFLGYKMIDVDYRSGTEGTPSLFVYDGTMQGALARVSFNL